MSLKAGSAATRLQASFFVLFGDFMEFAELMCLDALDRDESCGGHFRVEHQTADGEAKRDDARFSNVSVWEFTGVGNTPVKHVEELTFENVALAQRSYK
jgi:succinate dehydrogenase / fumarate reductase flavoprotein subunit